MGILMEAAEVNLDTASYRSKPELFGAMGTPSEYFAETVHTIAINTRETEFGSIVEPIPLTLKAYKQYAAHAIPVNGYNYGHTGHVPVTPAPRILEVERPSTSSALSPLKEVAKDAKKITIPPPKKKWIKEYLEEEPKSPVSRVVPGLVSARSNGVVRPTDRPRAASPLRKGAPSPALPAPAPADAPQPAPHPALLLDYVQEHSRPRPATTNLGSSQIPSPPSVSSNGSGSSGGSAPRAGTREVHNKLEKNRRAHLKECFELLKRQLPATQDDKKTSNLSILGSAIRYIQVLRRKERECEHEMERLAREKIAAQQRLAALKREVPPRPARSLTVDAVTEDKKDRDSLVNGQVAGMPINITSSPPRPAPMDASSPPHTLNLSTKLRTLPIQITPTTPQVVRTSYGSRHNTLTLTTLTSADNGTTNGQPIENGVTSALSTALVHPAQIHLPISQVVGSSGVVVGSALQLVSAGGGLRVLRHAHNGITTCENNRIAKENGIASPPVTAETTHGVVVSGLTPLVVSQPASAAHLLHTHTIAQKVVETQVVKGGVSPLSVSTQYVSAAAIVKPVVVVSAPTPPRPHPPA